MVCVAVARFAREKVQPLVRKMDDESQMDRSIITGMFDQGVSHVSRERDILHLLSHDAVDGYRGGDRVQWIRFHILLSYTGHRGAGKGGRISQCRV